MLEIFSNCSCSIDASRGEIYILQLLNSGPVLQGRSSVLQSLVLPHLVAHAERGELRVAGSFESRI